ncbi:hypothetical protein BpHYR1_034863 [Brachionus plicatilis]|uniref:Uncharacterized protein n=1 Tax=Brachionus plicatilis TaxID=10195 RepID=A0A3M7SHG6_BRAPC|nr:hypothetical protein BpHYR1_034863 [Brachionus plicatilis]
MSSAFQPEFDFRSMSLGWLDSAAPGSRSRWLVDEAEWSSSNGNGSSSLHCSLLVSSFVGFGLPLAAIADKKRVLFYDKFKIDIKIKQMMFNKLFMYTIIHALKRDVNFSHLIAKKSLYSLSMNENFNCKRIYFKSLKNFLKYNIYYKVYNLIKCKLLSETSQINLKSKKNSRFKLEKNNNLDIKSVTILED